MYLRGSPPSRFVCRRMARPPNSSSCSTRQTSKPWSAMALAAVMPARPPPTTRADLTTFTVTGGGTRVHPFQAGHCRGQHGVNLALQGALVLQSARERGRIHIHHVHERRIQADGPAQGLEPGHVGVGHAGPDKDSVGLELLGHTLNLLPALGRAGRAHAHHLGHGMQSAQPLKETVQVHPAVPGSDRRSRPPRAHEAIRGKRRHIPAPAPQPDRPGNRAP